MTKDQFIKVLMDDEFFEDQTKASDQAYLVGSHLNKEGQQAADDMLEALIPNLDSLPLDLLLKSADVALPYRAKLTMWGKYVNGLANEIESRGFNYRTMLKNLI